MKDCSAVIVENKRIAKDIWQMVLGNMETEHIKPGQFVNIKIEGTFLRRPISICDWDTKERTLTLLYKVVGNGTKILSRKKPGEVLPVLSPLGNGYDINCIPKHALLVGGGIGVPPMYGLAKCLVAVGKRPQVLLGFPDEETVFYTEKFRRLGISAKIHIGGLITDVMTQELTGTKVPSSRFEYVCSCGPTAMLQVVSKLAEDGQFSFESRMGCGFGACMGCTCKTKYGNKRICKDGPVLKKSQIIW